MRNLREVYMDNAATTRVKDEVLKEMIPYFSEIYGNPSSVYRVGRESKRALNEAREKVAKAIGAAPKEIYFTSGGSEADNWAIKGIAQKYKAKGKHIITSVIEHHAVLHTCEALEKEGFEVTYLGVDEDGLISLDELKAALREDTILVSIMFANNEIGTVEPIAEIGEIVKESGAFFHTDAVQAVGAIEIDVEALNIDLLSASAHKIYGPKGTGFLYVKKGIKLDSYIHGGGQERGKRAGTENVAGIVGFAKAIELATADLEAHSRELSALRDKLIAKIESNLDYIKLNGHRTKRLPGNVNFSFEFIEGEALLLSLDMKGIAGSSGSACTSGSLDPSHVLLAIGLPHEIAHGSLRLSLGDFNSEDELDYVVESLKDVVGRLRDMSPLYEKVKGGK